MSRQIWTIVPSKEEERRKVVEVLSKVTANKCRRKRSYKDDHNDIFRFSAES